MYAASRTPAEPVYCSSLPEVLTHVVVRQYGRTCSCRRRSLMRPRIRSKKHRRQAGFHQNVLFGFMSDASGRAQDHVRDRNGGGGIAFSVGERRWLLVDAIRRGIEMSNSRRRHASSSCPKAILRCLLADRRTSAAASAQRGNVDRSSDPS